jgi:hypothetical protein
MPAGEQRDWRDEVGWTRAKDRALCDWELKYGQSKFLATRQVGGCVREWTARRKITEAVQRCEGKWFGIRVRGRRRLVLVVVVNAFVPM